MRSGAPGRAEAVVAPDDAPDLPTSDDPRAGHVLDRLAKKKTTGWSLDRVIWRAGELALSDATPGIAALIEGAPTLRKYSCAWALGRTGAAAPAGSPHRKTAIDALEPLADVEGKTAVGRIATDALLMILEGEAASDLRDRIAARVPPTMQALVTDGASAEEKDAARRAVQRIADEKDDHGVLVLLDLYRLGATDVVIDAIGRLSTKKAHFGALRYLFKSAEYRRDGEVFGAVVRRFELSRGHYEGGFRPATRFYLRRRAWRTLSKLGKDKSGDYVKMAAGVLLAMKDEDDPEPASTRFWDWRSNGYNTAWFDRYSRCYAFSRILRGESQRHVVNPKTLRLGLKPGEQPQATPPRREESFGKLWEKQPNVLIDLLTRSRCGPVHEFAAKAVRACPDHLMTLDIPTVAKLLQVSYEVTARLAFELAEKRYDRFRPDLDLLLATANSTLADARSAAFRWIEDARSEVQKNAGMLAALMGSPRAETRRFTGELFAKLYISNDVGRACLARVVAELTSPDNTDEEWSADVAQVAVRVLAAHIGSLSNEVILDLASHPLGAVQVFAGHILLAHEKVGKTPPDEIIQKLLDSKHASARAVGAELFNVFDDDALLERAPLVATLVTHRHAELRKSIRPVAVRLATTSEEFAGTLMVMVVDAITHRDAGEDLVRDLHAVLTEELKPFLKRLPDDSIWRLLRAPATAAGDAAGIVLEAWSHDRLDMVEIVELASHDVLRVREAAWRFVGTDMDRTRAELPQAVRMLDAKWEDSRRAAAELFEKQLEDEDFTAEVLVSICDSNRDEVQQFGRDLVIRRFSADAASDYLLKLSEHPSLSMQAFVSGLLTSHAKGNLERLEKLVPYMKGALARVNRGRVAKDRIYDLCSSEIETREGAAIVAALLAEVSNTMAIGDKARAIEILLAVAQKHPDVENPLKTKSVEVRRAV